MLRAIIKFILLTVWILILIVLVQVLAFHDNPGDALIAARQCILEATDLDNVRQTYTLKSFESERNIRDREVWLITDRGSQEIVMSCIFRDGKLRMINHPEIGVVWSKPQ